jgi:hypothetical protein
MSHLKLSRYILTIIIISILLTIPLAGAGCATNTNSGVIATNLTANMVPDVNLDLYLYGDQGSPTSLPKNWFNATSDIQVNSLALWGVVNGDTYGIAGALMFANASDASNVYSSLSSKRNIWSKLSDRTIYAVQGSGGPAESLKNAIANNKFKPYDDTQALGETAVMPIGELSRPLAIGIIKPSQDAINLVKKYINPDTALTLDNIYKWAKPRTILFGLYATQPLNIPDVVQRFSNNTIWDMDLGVIASVDSAFPGFIVSPIASHLLDQQGYSQKSLGSLNVYKTTIDAKNGKTIPVLINVSGNHIFVTASVKEAFAETLMTEINR